jgi:hypothetical protein
VETLKRPEERERPSTEEESERREVLFSRSFERGRVGEEMKTMGQLLIGFTLLIVVASMVIVAGKVYLGEGPQGEERLVVPAATGSQPGTPRP